ncbi:MAG: DivIVA domain-containing protein [Bacilli bacterium]
MEKFKSSLNGYDKNQVNAFIDDMITKLEDIIKITNEKDRELKHLNETIQFYKNMEQTLSRAIITIQDTNDSIRNLAISDSKRIVLDAKNEAELIVSDAKVKAKEIDDKISNLNTSIARHKKIVKASMQREIEVIDEMDFFSYNTNNEFNSKK